MSTDSYNKAIGMFLNELVDQAELSEKTMNWLILTGAVHGRINTKDTPPVSYSLAEWAILYRKPEILKQLIFAGATLGHEVADRGLIDFVQDIISKPLLGISRPETLSYIQAIIINAVIMRTTVNDQHSMLSYMDICNSSHPYNQHLLKSYNDSGADLIANKPTQVRMTSDKQPIDPFQPSKSNEFINDYPSLTPHAFGYPDSIVNAHLPKASPDNFLREWPIEDEGVEIARTTHFQDNQRKASNALDRIDSLFTPEEILKLLIDNGMVNGVILHTKFRENENLLLREGEKLFTVYSEPDGADIPDGFKLNCADYLAYLWTQAGLYNDDRPKEMAQLKIETAFALLQDSFFIEYSMPENRLEEQCGIKPIPKLALHA